VGIVEREVGMMLKEAMDRSNVAPKAIAQDTNYSVDAYYAAMAGKRRIPADARKSVAKIHPLGGLAVAYQETGYKVFMVMEGDQHHQNVLQRTLKEDYEADQALQGMSFRLVDKQCEHDITEEDRLAIMTAAMELVDRIRADLSLLVTWEDTFKIQLVKLLLGAITEKEKAAIKATM